MSKPSSDGWQLFQLEALLKKVEGTEPRFYEFLSKRSMSMAVYRLPKGARDMQSPHLEDEIYLVIEGKATLEVDGRKQEASKGSILFVPANTPHTFFDIEEHLTVLAFFGAH